MNEVTHGPGDMGSAVPDERQTETSESGVRSDQAVLRAAEDVRAGKAKGILVIHGIGVHPQSSTLLEIGQPLVEWVRDWSHKRECSAWLERGGLGFRPYDDLSQQPPSHVVLNVLPKDRRQGHAIRWVVAEAWWSADVPKPRFNELALWSLKNYWNTGRDLGRHLEGRRVALRGGRSDGDPGVWTRAVDLINLWLLTRTGLFWFGFLAALPIILLLLLLTQVPVPAVRQFALVQGFENFLDTNMADFEAVTDDKVVAANIRERVIRALCWLSEEQKCEDLYVIAHSGGVVLAFEALCDREYPQQEHRDLIERVRNFFTLGQAFNKALAINPKMERLNLALDREIGWQDFWSPYDPVPVTALNERFKVHAPGKGPESMPVVNQMDLASEHGLYWSNSEQVLCELAREIEPQDPLGGDWIVEDRRKSAVAQRRLRVAVLVAFRLWAILLTVATGIFRGFGFAGDGALQSNGAHVWEIVGALPGMSGGVHAIGAVLRRLAVPDAAVHQIRLVAYTAIGAGLVIILFWILQQLFTNVLWDEWDEHDRDAFVAGTAINKGWLGLLAWPILPAAAAVWLGSVWAPLAALAIVGALALAATMRYFVERQSPISPA